MEKRPAGRGLIVLVLPCCYVYRLRYLLLSIPPLAADS